MCMRCPNGYTGDGQKCRGIQFDHNLLMLDVNVCPNGYTGDGQKCRGIQFDHHLLMLDVNVCLAFVQNVI